LTLYKCPHQKIHGIIWALHAQLVDTKKEAQLVKDETLVRFFTQLVLNQELVLNLDNHILEALVLKQNRQLQEEDLFILRRQKKNSHY